MAMLLIILEREQKLIKDDKVVYLEHCFHTWFIFDRRNDTVLSKIGRWPISECFAAVICNFHSVARFEREARYTLSSLPQGNHL